MKTKNILLVINSIIFYSSIISIITIIALPISISLSNLHITDNTIKDWYISFSLIAIPILTLIVFLTRIKRNKIWIVISKIVLYIITSFTVYIIILFLFFASIFLDMCQWNTRKILYQHKKNKNILIIEEDFGCGATDGSPATVSIRKLIKINSYFCYKTSIDTSKIDKSQWIKQ